MVLTPSPNSSLIASLKKNVNALALKNAGLSSFVANALCSDELHTTDGDPCIAGYRVWSRLTKRPQIT